MNGLARKCKCSSCGTTFTIRGLGNHRRRCDPSWRTAEGIPGHYYRFESILKSHFLIKDTHAKLGYSFSGGDIPFDAAGVHEFDANAKIKDYDAFPPVRRQMKRFNDNYTSMINSLQGAFNCPSPDRQEQAMAAYDQAVGIMRNMANTAAAIVQKAEENKIKAGVPFEFTRPPTS